VPDTVTNITTRDRISSFTVQLGAVIILFGFLGYFGSGMITFVSLIPLVFGIPLLVFGRLSTNEKRHKLWIRFAVFFSLLCALTTWAGFMDLIGSIQMSRIPSLSQMLRTTMFFGCSAYTGLVFVYLWRLRKRRKRKTENQSLRSDA
jgi:apolipoprotein N-acyltransferase